MPDDGLAALDDRSAALDDGPGEHRRRPVLLLRGGRAALPPPTVGSGVPCASHVCAPLQPLEPDGSMRSCLMGESGSISAGPASWPFIRIT